MLIISSSTNELSAYYNNAYKTTFFYIKTKGKALNLYIIYKRFVNQSQNRYWKNHWVILLEFLKIHLPNKSKQADAVRIPAPACSIVLFQLSTIRVLTKVPG
jgi:hypothetical protein